MKVNILGTEYNVNFYDKNFPKPGYDGYCDTQHKEIHIKGDSVAVKEVLRHEIVHAFFHESGLTEYGCDEVLVEWIAMQFDKIAKAVQEAGDYND